MVIIQPWRTTPYVEDRERNLRKLVWSGFSLVQNASLNLAV